MLTSSSNTVRHARQTIELLQRETSKFIPADLWPQSSLILIQLTINGAWCRIECIKHQVRWVIHNRCAAN